MKIKYLILLTTVAMTAGYFYMNPRNVRNNNPLNIKESADWEGESPINADKTFEEFTTPEYGFRAAYRILMTYRNTYGLTTVSEIISRWAPPPEKAGDDHNETQAYIDYVLNRLDGMTIFGFETSVPLEQYPELMLAMADFEGARGAFTLEQAKAGVSLA